MINFYYEFIMNFNYYLSLKLEFVGYFTWVAGIGIIDFLFRFTHFVSVAAAARSTVEARPHSSSPLKEKQKK